MNEVEKMYENVLNLKQKCSNPYIDPEYCAKDCKECKDFRYDYPPFTAEKQLKIMAFLINRKVGLSFKAEQGEITVEAISRGLAGIVNRIWQDLTEEERTQIKNILESEVRE